MGCAFGGLGTGPLPDPDWRSDSVTRGWVGGSALRGADLGGNGGPYMQLDKTAHYRYKIAHRA